MKNILWIMLFTLLSFNVAHSNNLEVKSPDGKITLEVNNQDHLNWSVRHNGQILIQPSSFGTGRRLGCMHRKQVIQ